MIIYRNYKYFELFLLNVFAISFYFIVFSLSLYGVNDDSLFFTPDSQTYFDTSHEFYNFNITGYSLYRPFFYPMILGFIYSIGGAFLVWFMQFLFWLSSINLLFFILKKHVNKWLVWSITLIYISNISLIILTQLALTEILCVFLTCLLLYLLFLRNPKEKNTADLILFLLVLLTVTRPVYFYVLLLFLVYYLIKYFYYFTKIKIILKTGIIIFPLLFQISLMKYKYDLWKVSDIDTLTIRDYLVAQMIQEENKDMTRDESLIKAKEIENTKLFILEKFPLAVNMMIKNINESLRGWPSLIYNKPYENIRLGKYMEKLNIWFYYIHIILIFPLLFFIYKQWNYKSINFLAIIFVFFILGYIIFSSGISFMQGDRLIITVFPIWLLLYALTINYIILVIKKRCTFLIK